MEEIKSTHHKRRSSRDQICRRLQGKLLTALLLGTVGFFVLFGLLQKDKEFSQSENRKLTQLPSVKEEHFLKDLGSYAADQFPLRDKWISLNLTMNRFLGQKEVNGVYLCKDHTLMQIPSEPNLEQRTRNLKAVDAFAADHPEIRSYMAIIPNAVSVQAQKLPKNAPVRDQMQDLADIASQVKLVQFVNVSDNLMTHRDEYLYYRTDHHWTSLGALYAVQSIASAMQLPVSGVNYQPMLVSNTFEGTLSSKSGSHSTQDEVEIYVPQTLIDYYVSYGTQDSSTMYDRSALEQKDHYTVFFGGNHPRVDITTTADTGRSLLMFKDSYANCTVQFLYPYFDHITMIDPRYYYDNVELVLKEESVTDILYLYNLDTFNGDTSLADVLNTESN